MNQLVLSSGQVRAEVHRDGSCDWREPGDPPQHGSLESFCRRLATIQHAPSYGNITLVLMPAQLGLTDALGMSGRPADLPGILMRLLLCQDLSLEMTAVS